MSTETVMTAPGDRRRLLTAVARRRAQRRGPWNWLSLLQRVVGAVGVLWAAATLTFVAQQAMSGSPAEIILGGGGYKPSAQQLASVNRIYGFNQPVLTQYLHFIVHLLQGNLGESYLQHQPVTTIIGQQAWPTIELTLVSLALSWVIALLVTVATTKRGRFFTGLGSGFEIVTAGLPQYWLGTILVVIFAVELRWFPVEGGDGLQSLVLPAVTLALPLAGFLGQVTRDEFTRVLDQPFITSARARGMSDTGVRLRHALRHAVLPGITLSGWGLGSLFSGAVLVEAVFARQGLGSVLTTAVSGRDMPVVVGVTLLVALVYVVANIFVDIAYVLVDPEIRIS